MIFWPDDVKGIIHHGGDRYWLDRHNKKYANLFWHTQQIQSAQKSEEIYGDRETSVTKIIERKKNKDTKKKGSSGGYKNEREARKKNYEV